MHRNKSVSVHQFAMVPKAEIPRSRFRMQHTHKTTFDAGYLVPIYCEEVLPGDTFNMRMTAFARLATPLFPIMDNLHLDTFFFFVPNRLVWDNWQKFMGEQRKPGDSTDYLVPQIVSPAGGFAVGSIYDYFGCPTVGQVGAGQDVSVSALPFRGYNLIFNEWFRDQNLQESQATYVLDGPDPDDVYKLLRRGKRHDYFTSCLPWPQKGESVALPLGTSAPVVSNIFSGGDGFPTFNTPNGPTNLRGFAADDTVRLGVDLTADTPSLAWNTPNLIADLSQATAATVNQLRQSFQIQKLLERDARGGTRYTEILRAHFGVVSPDARLQRPEYLGGGTTSISISPIAQTSGTAGSGGYTDTPQGNLAAVGTALARNHGFHQSFTEHGYIIGLASVRADLTYQQGLRRHWSRRTRYDYYFLRLRLWVSKLFCGRKFIVPVTRRMMMLYSAIKSVGPNIVTAVRRLPDCSRVRRRERLMRGIWRNVLRLRLRCRMRLLQRRRRSIVLRRLVLVLMGSNCCVICFLTARRFVRCRCIRCLV